MENKAGIWYAPSHLSFLFVTATHSNTAGLTETSTVVCSTAADDIWFGSSGSLLPSYEAKLVTIEGHEITGYDQPGELVVRSPSVVLGYLNNDQANAETFQDGWMRTGDEAVVRKSPKGNEHIFIVDRIKELIKVKVRIR
jgi:long-subunit acyl-CoA synthetase (AMP-forming)